MRQQSRAYRVVLAAFPLVLVPAVASAYSTKLHMITGYHIAEKLKKDCKINVGGWNNDKSGVNLKATKIPGLPDGQTPDETKPIDLSGEVCKLITNPVTRQIFISATTGPDTFPGMFGNTDPTHALLWNTAWQIPVLWQNAKTPEEKAFVLGWVVHFAGDLNAHGLANLHADGVWMAGGVMKTVWGHIVSETYYAANLLPYPKNFDNRLKWPLPFVKRMFFSPESPLYQHWDYLWNRYVGTEDIGVVSKIFGTIYRAHFLLWDMHAREANRWEGRKEYFKPRQNKSLNDWFHWLFADQAWNYNKKKEAAAQKAIDVWIEATHRAQQAIVSDDKGVVKKDLMYNKVIPGKPTKKNHYKGGGIGGIQGSYEYWFGEGIIPLISPDLITITKENFPLLFQIMEQIKKVWSGLLFIADALKQGFAAFIEILTKPLTLILDAIKAALQPMIDELKAYLKEEGMCNPKSPMGLPAMCKAIKDQRAAFKINPGNIETYMNWPIYRNTITAAALMLKKMQTLPKDKGDETMSPFFGLPSGDFGCTLECTGVFNENAAFFMPVAGKYYEDKGIRAALPDYCAAGKERRRMEAVNEGFKGTTNNLANITDTKPDLKKGQNPGFTCFAAGNTGANHQLPAVCPPGDAYGEHAPGLVPSYGKKVSGWKDQFKNLMAWFNAKIGGRWDFHTHGLPHAGERYVVPPTGERFVWNGGEKAMEAKRGETEQSFETEEFTWLKAKEESPDQQQPPGETGKYAIEVISATYGGNCRGVRKGNQTKALQAACNGKTSCAYTVDTQVIGDPARGCSKGYTAEYRCAANGDVKTASIPGEAGFRKTFAMSCVAAQDDTSYRNWNFLRPVTLYRPTENRVSLVTPFVVPAPIPRTGKKAPYCYKALGYDKSTIANDFDKVNPLKYHKASNKKEPYSIQAYVTNAFAPIAKWLGGTLNDAWNALKEKVKQEVCKQVKKIDKSFQEIEKGVCAVQNALSCTKSATTTQYKKRCVLGVCGDVFDGYRFDQKKFEQCIMNKCKEQKTITEIIACPKK